MINDIDAKDDDYKNGNLKRNSTESTEEEREKVKNKKFLCVHKWSKNENLKTSVEFKKEW